MRSLVNEPQARWMRRALCALCVASALTAQYWLAHVPVAAPLKGPIAARVGQRLVLINPRTSGRLFEVESQPHQTMDLMFRSLRLSAQFERILHAQAQPVAPRYGKGGWVTTAKPAAQRTYLEVGVQDINAPPTRLTFLQYDKFQGASFALRASGGEITLRAYAPLDPECGKNCRSQHLLWLEEPALRVGGNFNVHVIVQDGGELLAKITAPAINGAEPDAYAEIQFAGETSGDGPAHLLVDGVAVLEGSGESEQVIELACAATRGHIAWLASRGEPDACASGAAAPGLKLTTLKIGKSALVLDTSGNAWQWRDGESSSQNWLDLFTRNPLLGLVLAMFNTALLEWARREWLSRGKRKLSSRMAT